MTEGTLDKNMTKTTLGERRLMFSPLSDMAMLVLSPTR